eukprot:TRINITY_DN25330_c0_g1_i1.p1 TRINITY_DN25330_c0_g1~~TRINITY_DN25330_c0_g1_i1.p1  ORF type:complete len:586 (+),score=82.07 TRINITY_DN25330_c0_g1_i1:70-1827(+)
MILRVGLLLVLLWRCTSEKVNCKRLEDVMGKLSELRYDKDARPGLGGPPVDVMMQIYLSSIVTINQQLQSITIDGYFRLYWVDPRLANVSMGGDDCPMDGVSLPQHYWNYIWRPDIYFDNSVKESYGAGLLEIHPNGTVWQSQKINHEFACTLRFDRLPFDSQTCYFKLASYSKGQNEINSIPHPNGGLQKPDEYNGTTDWRVGENALASWQKIVTFGNDETAKGWSYVWLSLTVSRREAPHLRSTVATIILFILVSWSGMFISRKAAPARVTMAVIPLLIMLNLQNSVQAALPTLDSWTWLTGFCSMSMVFCTIVIFEFGVVSYMLYLEEVVRSDRFQALQAIAAKASRLRNTGEESRHIQVRQVRDSFEVCSLAPKPCTVSLRKVAAVSVDAPEIIPPYPDADSAQKTGSQLTTPSLQPSASSLSIRSAASNRSPRLSALMAETLDVRNWGSASRPKKKTKGNSSSLSESQQVMDYLFSHFDRSGNGSLTCKELRAALRLYGLYFSLHQVAELFKSTGVPDGEEMTQKEFEVMVADLNSHWPTKDLDPSYWDLPPSLRVDIAMRWIFIVAYFMATGIFALQIV